MYVNVAAFQARSRANGPGQRAVVWVQGCPFRCEGCFNRRMQPFRPNRLMEVRELVDKILSQPGCNGVTFSGGEPFSQAEPLAELAASIRANNMNLITYTGYEYSFLARTSNRGQRALLKATDLLISGPFIESLRCSSPLRGSSNQEFQFLTERLSGHPELTDTEGQTVEFVIRPGGTTETTGFPETEVPEVKPARAGQVENYERQRSGL